jgi:hypothetical protein
MTNDKIIMKLQGGLGNQMFQYALGRHLALKNNADLNLDISHYKEDKKREYELKHFNIVENFATNEEIKSFKKFKKCHKRIIGRLYNAIFADESKYILENHFRFMPEVLINARSNVYLDGYWQTEKYFIDIQDIIRKDFLPKKISAGYEKNLKQNQSKISISIHIRRRDYAQNKKTFEHHGICSPEYYKTAAERIKQVIKKPSYFIFSDDIEWAKNNFKIDGEIIFVSNGILQNYEEMILMSKCDHNIIANSSFSWWGAWLNPNKEKIVIAPKRWFQTPKMDTRDLIPDSWIKI